MEKLIFENSFGDKITMTDKFPFFLEEYDGIHGKTSELYGVSSAFGIGELYIGRSVNKRNITITGIIKDKFIERRQFLYNIFPDDDEGILYYYEKSFSAKIRCRVEKLDIIEGDAIKRFTVSLMAFNPFFEEIEEHILSLTAWEKKLSFPLEIPEGGLEVGIKTENTIASINNPTKIETGLKIIFKACGVVVNPVLRNISSNEELSLDFEMQASDKIIITTAINDKNILLERDGEITNINNYLKFGTKYLQIKPGQNYFKVSAKEGAKNLIAEISYSLSYEAI